MSIDKSLKQHYETQAGVKNFLGKQKMVKAPKYWLSKPGHVKAKLAYITDEEEQILIDKNLYGSLRGKPNKGPAGLPSLQGGDFGAGGGGGSSGGGGNGGGGRPHGGWSSPAPAPAPAPAPDRQDRARQQAAIEQAARETKPAMLGDTGGSLPTTFMPGVDIGFEEALRKTEATRQKEQEFLETGDLDVLTDLTGFDPSPKVDVKDIMGEVTDPGSVSYDPTYKTPEEIRTLSQDPNYGQFFRQPTVIEAPKRSGLTTVLNIASLAAPFLKLPAKVTSGIKTAKALSDIKQGKGILGQEFKRTGIDFPKISLASNIRTPSNVIDTRTSAIDMKPDREDRVDMQPKEKPTAVAKDPITKGIETYTGKKQDSTDLMSLYKILLQNRTRLTPQGLNIFELISKYLRNPVEGRSRDIG